MDKGFLLDNTSLGKIVKSLKTNDIPSPVISVCDPAADAFFLANETAKLVQKQIFLMACLSLVFFKAPKFF